MLGSQLNKLSHYSQRLGQVGLYLSFIVLSLSGLAMMFTAPVRDAVAVDIATDPPEATVHLDGKMIGQTPVCTLLPEGEHELVISREGYKEIRRRIFADASAPAVANEYKFGLMATAETLSQAKKAKQIESIKRRTEEAFKRGDYVAPEHDSVLYYLSQLQELDPTNPLIGKMRERIRRLLKQQSETTHLRNDLA